MTFFDQTFNQTKTTIITSHNKNIYSRYFQYYTSPSSAQFSIENQTWYLHKFMTCIYMAIYKLTKSLLNEEFTIPTVYVALLWCKALDVLIFWNCHIMLNANMCKHQQSFSIYICTDVELEASTVIVFIMWYYYCFFFLFFLI